MNLDEAGYVKGDVDYDDACWLGEDDPACHAPSDYVAASLLERERLRRRDLNELQDLWREEMQARKRERAPILRGRFHREPHCDSRRDRRTFKREAVRD